MKLFLITITILCISTIQVTSQPTKKIRVDGLYQKSEDYYGNSFIRFYSDGTVIVVSTTEDEKATDVIKWIKRGNPKLSEGKYEIELDKIYFPTKSLYGIVIYEGIIESEYKLILSSKSLINGHKETDVIYYFKSVGGNSNSTPQSTSPIAKSPPPKVSGSGTGYAISSNGYIVTNYHVTERASTIKIRGVNGNFAKTYSAKVVVEDKKNDLSIIKINDPSFISLGVIPYTIANHTSDVGSSVFVLGYPLRATMGDEVKLTNGIISSKSGFQGDITSYQITVPTQPGNSGGPLFDSNGNAIGVINAKHVDAENVSYAIKSSYLLNLIGTMSEPTNN